MHGYGICYPQRCAGMLKVPSLERQGLPPSRFALLFKPLRSLIAYPLAPGPSASPQECAARANVAAFFLSVAQNGGGPL